MTEVPGEVPITALEPDIDSVVERAQMFARLAHWGQTDKVGVPYIEHPRRCIGYLPVVLEHFGEQVHIPVDVHSMATLEAILWLHDTIEDCDWVTESVLSTHFDSIIIGAVTRMTRGYFSTDNALYEEMHGLPKGSEYYRIVAGDPWSRIAKICDLLDNTDPERSMRLSQDNRLRLQNKYWIAADALDARDFINGFNAERWQAYNTTHPGRHASSPEQ